MLSKYNLGYIIYVVNLSQPCFFLKAFRTCRAKGVLGSGRTACGSRSALLVGDLIEMRQRAPEVIGQRTARNVRPAEFQHVE